MQRLKTTGLCIVRAGDWRNLAVPKGTNPKLLDRMRDAMRCRHSSGSTEKFYRNWVNRFVYHKAGKLPYVSPFLCHTPVGGWVRYPDRARALGS